MSATLEMMFAMTALPVVCIEEASLGLDERTELTVAHMLRLLEQDGWIESVHIQVHSADQLQAALLGMGAE